MGGRRFVIFGAGAVGGVIGAQLARGGVDVSLIARGAHAAAIRAGGLTLEHPDGTDIFPIPVAERPADVDWRDDDVVVLAVKSQDTQEALRALAVCAPPSLAIACAQNGVDNERVALRHFADVYGVVVMCPTQHLERGVVQANSWPVPGLLDVGRYPSGSDGTAKEIAEGFHAGAFESIVRDDIMRWKYTKLLMNLANSIVALCGTSSDAARDLMKRVRAEGMSVLAAAGIDYASMEDDAERRGGLLTIKPIAGATRGGGSSWQSLARGTGTIETDWLNGEIVAVARAHGVAAPVNELLQRAANAAAARGAAPESVDAEMLLAEL